jgi:predicted phage-related endonuclease
MEKPKKYRKFIGPSQFATVLGLDEYQTADSLKNEIENGYVPNSTYATQFGCDNESIALYYFKKIYNIHVTKGAFVVDPKNKRIGGICDGIIDDDTGIEIKCHVKEENLLTTLPIKYLLQVTGYMYLYKKKSWRLMSATFNPDNTLSKHVIHNVTWDEVKDRWETEWYPKITAYVNEAKFR